mmetsp:Transcript_110949/g.353477  ORF Transcript_110949/g.353477 Transcript_110949/m.353477 type:complete len:83 (+) Transcript_110949:1937-2185(+)
MWKASPLAASSFTSEVPQAERVVDMAFSFGSGGGLCTFCGCKRWGTWRLSLRCMRRTWILMAVAVDVFSRARACFGTGTWNG